jgi:hypothetical protein
MVRNKIVGSLLGGMMALSLLGGAVALAQPEEQTVVATTSPTSLVLVQDSDESTTEGDTASGSLTTSVDRYQYLADALGMTLEEFTADKETARLAMIDQAVADGLITADEAETLKAADTGFTRLAGQFGYEKAEFLAAALDISVAELDAAQLEAYEVELAGRVAAGDLTQEEADLKLAQKAAEGYIDTDSINAQVRSAQEAAIAAALEDGAITQAQADALLAYLDANPYQFNGFNGRGGHGGRGGGRGHGGGRGFDSLETTPATPSTDTPTTTGSGA